MKKYKTTIMVFLFLLGIIIMLYPKISDLYNRKVQLEAIEQYKSVLDDYEEQDYSKYFDEANLYNKKLATLEEPFLNYKKLTNYKTILNTDGLGMIGYITIDRINVKLPIYHSTTKDVLNMGVGHLEGSSFPIGGDSTHSVLSAHRGLPSSKLFTNLDKLELGDIFIINVLDQELTYQVDSINIVKPNDTTKLKIENSKDYITLMTCTPYGINTHRLLVRGVRIENLIKTYVTNDASKIDNLIVALCITIVVVLLSMVIRKKKRRGMDDLIKEYVFPSTYNTKSGGTV